MSGRDRKLRKGNGGGFQREDDGGERGGSEGMRRQMRCQTAVNGSDILPNARGNEGESRVGKVRRKEMRNGGKSQRGEARSAEISKRMDR